MIRFCCLWPALLGSYVLTAQSFAPPLRQREVRWYQAQGIEPAQYKWYHPETRHLFNQVRQQRLLTKGFFYGGLGIVAYGVVKGIQTNLQANSGQPTALGASVDRHLNAPKAYPLFLRVGFSIPLFAATGISNRNMERHLVKLRDCTVCREGER